jgi:hypothetical protein
MNDVATDLAVFEQSLERYAPTDVLPAHLGQLANALLDRAKAAAPNSEVLQAVQAFEDNGRVVTQANAGSVVAVVAQARQEISRGNF